MRMQPVHPHGKMGAVPLDRADRDEDQREARALAHDLRRPHQLVLDGAHLVPSRSSAGSVSPLTISDSMTLGSVVPFKNSPTFRPWYNTTMTSATGDTWDRLCVMKMVESPRVVTSRI